MLKSNISQVIKKSHKRLITKASCVQENLLSNAKKTLFFLDKGIKLFYRDFCLLYTCLLNGCFISISLSHSQWVGVQSAVTGMMTFLHLDLSLARPIFRCFLQRSALTTSSQITFSQLRHVGLSKLKFLVFFVHDVSSYRYK